jgi:Arc/MetJ-type ribon-helix-helix transcriptional regulator
MATITVRIDSEVEELLADLMADGSDRSTVIRDAVRLAWRERRRQQVLAESESIASDEQDRAEIAAAQRDMEQLRAW